jgi:hypothetical protein
MPPADLSTTDVMRNSTKTVRINCWCKSGLALGYNEFYLFISLVAIIFPGCYVVHAVAFSLLNQLSKIPSQQQPTEEVTNSFHREESILRS